MKLEIDEVDFGFKREIITAQTFPADYKTFGNAKFYCGMSVAPVQMAHIASAIWEQWLKPLGRGKCAAPTKQLCALRVSAPLR